MSVKRITNEDGFDVTEGIQVILDALHSSMDAGSGMLDWREWCAIRQVAHALGVDPDGFTGKGASSAGFCTYTYDGSYNRKVHGWPDPATALTDAPMKWDDADV